MERKRSKRQTPKQKTDIGLIALNKQGHSQPYLPHQILTAQFSLALQLAFVSPLLEQILGRPSSWVPIEEEHRAIPIYGFEKIRREKTNRKMVQGRQVAGRVFVFVPPRIELQESFPERVRSANVPRSVPKTRIPQRSVG